VARKNNITHSTVLRILKKNDVIHKKRVKILNYTPIQLEKIPRCCRYLLCIGTVKGQAVDVDVFITKCLPKMVKFIEKHHKNDETIFWTELEKRWNGWSKKTSK
jgi:hypothetical protein